MTYTSGGASTTGQITLKATQSNDASVKDSGWVTVATGIDQAPTVALASVNPGTIVEVVIPVGKPHESSAVPVSA